MCRQGNEDDIHFVCNVDLLERSAPERDGEVDDAQEHAYAEDLEARIQRIMDAREATRNRGVGGSGVMVPPLSSAHEWRQPVRAREMNLRAFGQGVPEHIHRDDAGEAEQGHRGQEEQKGARESNLPPYVRIKQEGKLASPLDDYFCKGMDTSGPAAWVLRDMSTGALPEVGTLNAREGVREEKWVSFDLRTVKFPSTQTSSVRRATLIQNF